MYDRILIAIFAAVLSCIMIPALFAEETVIAEGEAFRLLDDKGWQVTHQDDS